ncbi:MAG: hypothetical protein ACREIQ_07150 [Nitrospiria bacterium]
MSKKNPRLTHHIFIYADADVIVTHATEEKLAEQDIDRQAELIAGFLCRSTPDSVVRKFCEMTGADYEKIVTTGFSALAPEDVRKRRESHLGKNSKLNPVQVKKIRSLKKTHSQAKRARMFKVSEWTIRQIDNRALWGWVKD